MTYTFKKASFAQFKKALNSAIVFLLLGVGTGSAMAVNPKVGAWWSPTEPGRGFVIDGSGSTLVMQAYTYDSAGQPQWYLAVGQLTNNGANWSGTLQKYTGGQCFGCAYKPAQENGNDGVVTINFTSDTTGVITMPNGLRSNIQAFFAAGSFPSGGSGSTTNLAATYQCTAYGDGSANGTVVINAQGGVSLSFRDSATGAIYSGSSTIQANGTLNATTSGTVGSSEGTVSYTGTFSLPVGTSRPQGSGQWISSLGGSGSWVCYGQ